MTVDVNVPDVARSIHSNEASFGVAPSVVKDGGAKRMLEDPFAGFASSQRG